MNTQAINLLYYLSDKVYFVEKRKGDEFETLNKCIQIM